jgi:hypothetical protein
MFVLDVEEEIEFTLLADSAVPLNCLPLVPLKCVIIVRRGPRSSPTGRRFRNVERRVVTKQNMLRLPLRTLQPVHHVYFAGNPRNRGIYPSAHQNVTASLTPGLRSSLKFLEVMLLSRKVRLLFIFAPTK